MFHRLLYPVADIGQNSHINVKGLGRVLPLRAPHPRRRLQIVRSSAGDAAQGSTLVVITTGTVTD